MLLTKLNVFIRFFDDEILIGQLVLDGREILFKYSDQYLETGHNISPLKLNFSSDIQTGPIHPFGGLFGVFADSLPDAWGNLLLKKHLNKTSVRAETLNSLDRLSFVGENGLGALVYKPSSNTEETQLGNIDLDTLNSDIVEVLKGESRDVIDLLFEKGGSPGGARPKIYASYNKSIDTLIHGNSILEEGYEHWIIKFAASVDSDDIANVEMAYYYMALAAGLEMNECRLFSGNSDKQYFGTKRFDRVGNKRIHMISAAGLFHDDYEHSQLDYGILIQESGKLIDSATAHDQLLRQAAFNVFAHNRDDHSKNFAFLMDPNGRWRLAPAYDLTFSSSSQGQHSTTCAGNGINPGSKELLSLTEHFSIKNGKQIIEEVKDAVSNWSGYAEKAEVTNGSRKSIKKVLDALIKT